jgi:hypothetical protein
MAYGKTEKSVEVVIDAEGNTQIEAKGYTDGSCRSATDAIEKALGGVSARQMKDHGAREGTEGEKVTS